MQRKNRILSLIDFSEHSETILRYTKNLCTDLQAEVVLIHQLPGIVTARASADVREQIYKAEREDAFEHLHELATPIFGTVPAMVASQQNLTEMLDNLKNEAFFDWLFIGLKGTSFLEQVFLGSKATEVLEDTDYITIAYPLMKDYFAPQELVVALHADYSFDSTQLSTLLVQLSGKVSRITFLTVATDAGKKADCEALLSGLCTEFSAYQPSAVVMEDSNVLKEVERYLQQKENSVLVVQENDPSLRDFVFNRGLIRELIYKSFVPMIILPYLSKSATNAG